MTAKNKFIKKGLIGRKLNDFGNSEQIKVYITDACWAAFPQNSFLVRIINTMSKLNPLFVTITSPGKELS